MDMETTLPYLTAGANLQMSTERHFCTFQENINERRQGIEVHKLPKMFRHAITVTRELGKRYLWIDSLCIIQNDPEDSKREAKTMEMVYSVAYVTIAATSTKDSTHGFLKPREQRKFVKIEKPPQPLPLPPPPPARIRDENSIASSFSSRRRMPEPYKGRKLKAYEVRGDGTRRDLDAGYAAAEVEQFPLYICEHIDDFTSDVEKSILNSRGWVFQERGLSRRILHFSAAQTYWECSVGVHCETLTLMYNSDANILGDPQFPSSISQCTDGANISFFESQPADRGIAFTGLEKRLAAAFNTSARYGIIEKFLHRCLLWLRATDASLVRTRPGPDETQKETLPSWSWMGCGGRIDFLQVDFEQVAWNEAVRFPTSDALECRVREFQGCRMVHERDRFALVDDGPGIEDDDQNGIGESKGHVSDNGSPVLTSDENGDGIPVDRVGSRGWLRFDVDAFDIETLKCAIIGRKVQWGDNQYGKECCVIVVRPSGNKLFERVGQVC